MKRLWSLDAWRVAQDLAAAAYELTQSGTLQRHFALMDQIRRAAISVPANIAEGYALASRPQFIRCLRIALGSAAELATHLHLVHRLRLAPADQIAKVQELADRGISVIVGLLKKLCRTPASRFPLLASRIRGQETESNKVFVR
jgi:four helix bundle protein